MTTPGIKRLEKLDPTRVCCRMDGRSGIMKNQFSSSLCSMEVPWSPCNKDGNTVMSWNGYFLSLIRLPCVPDPLIHVNNRNNVCRNS